MPEPEGAATFQALRRDAPSTGIVALAGAFAGRPPTHAYSLRADAVLRPPMTAELLLAEVAHVLQSRRQASGSARL